MVGIRFLGVVETELWSFCQTDAPLNKDIVNYYNPIFLLFIRTIEFINPKTDSISSLLCKSNIDNIGHMKPPHGRTVQLLIDFIPIILVYLFASQPREMILFSDSSLGRFIAVAIILFYASIAPVYGFFICAIIVLYYQTDMVEHMLNQKKDIRFEEGLMNLTYELWNGPTPLAQPWTQPIPSETPSSFAFYQTGDAGIYKYVPYQTKSEENEDKFDKSLPTSISPNIPKYNQKATENPLLGKADDRLFPWRN
jgi:hypothetical protein